MGGEGAGEGGEDNKQQFLLFFFFFFVALVFVALLEFFSRACVCLLIQSGYL